MNALSFQLQILGALLDRGAGKVSISLRLKPKKGNSFKMDDIENSEWWKEAIAQANSLSEIEYIFRKLWPSLFPKLLRNPLFDFPDVIIHASETSVKKHPSYHNAKTGDAESASILIDDTLNSDAVDEIRNLQKSH